jgi:hypothetical protein
MIRKLAVAALFTFLLGGVAIAQSAEEKAKATGKDTKRELKKAGHRVEETLCTGTKAECAAKKANHRLEEAKDKAVDTVDKAKDKID